MTDREKAFELSSVNKHGFSVEESNAAYNAALEMAQWKEQQMIKYLYKNIQSLLKDYGVSEASTDIATKLFLVNFKQSMEEK